MADVSALWPTVTDDDGTGQTGTVLDKSLFDAIAAAIDDQVDSATNPLIKPWNTTDEVVTARGNKASLNARLSGVIDADGALITPASVITQAQMMASVGSVNLIPNDTFLIWSDGDTAAPDYWSLAGSTAARCGTGLADTKRKIGKFCISLTNAGNLTRTMIDAGVYGNLDHMDGEKIGFGAWVWSTIASHARLEMTDGTDTTVTSWHTGGSGAGGWEFLANVHTINAAATKLELDLDVSSNGTAYFSGVTAIYSDVAPTRWIPCPKRYDSVDWYIDGVVGVANNQRQHTFARPALIKEVFSTCIGVPGAGGCTGQIHRSHSGGYKNLFSADPHTLMVEAKKSNSSEPDGTYQYRCISGSSTDAATSTATGLEGGLIDLDIAANNGTDDLAIHIRYMEYINMLEDGMAFDDI
jgi:hypothetical protein